MDKGRDGRIGSRRRQGRGRLSSEEILNEAERLVAAHGLHQLSMPRLAEQLGSAVTSIYWYFHSKDELIVALTERVSKQTPPRLPPVGDGPWDDEIVEYFAAYRELMQRAPVLREVLAYRDQALYGASPLSRSILRRLEAGLSIFVKAGLTPQQAVESWRALSNYTSAFILLEHGSASIDPVGAIAEPDRQFRFGLRLVADGIRQEYPVLDRPAAANRPDGQRVRISGRA
jgi:AcrR family transcriptional regulator